MVKIEFYFETMAGTHLSDAVRALRDSGSSDALYAESVRRATPGDRDEATYSISLDIAEYERVSYSRKALLFAAFAAEAYANDLLYDTWAGQDREVLSRLSTVEKYVFLPQLAGSQIRFSRDQQPIQRLRWLFKRRDELVHAAPREADLTYFPENHNPRDAAECIVAVVAVAAGLFGKPPQNSYLSYAMLGKRVILDYGQRAAASLLGSMSPQAISICSAT